MKTYKSILKTGLAAVVLTGSLFSCSKDELADGTGDGTVIFSAVLDDAASTRAFGDGTSANRLHYAVYDDNGDFVTEGKATVTGKTANVTLQLTSGATYDIAFFATRGNNQVYAFDAATKSVTVDYSQMGGTSSRLSYDDDCFHAVRKGFKAGSSRQEEVVLTRAVAQVNFGTDDADAETVVKYYGSRIYAGLKTEAFTRLDLLTGEASDEKEIALKLKYIKADEAFPAGSQYRYLAMAYVLTGTTPTLRDLTLGTGKSQGDYATGTLKELTVPNAPTRRNYRTNIYGSLLTAASDWTVEIEPIFDGASDIWTGDTKSPVQDGNDPNLYTVNSPAELAGLAAMVNAGDDFAGKTVLLTADCNLNNINWTPIGTWEKPFNGIFDGQGHTVSNLSVTLGGTSVPAGLFGCVKSNGSNKGEVRDLVIDGATINTLAATPATKGTGVAIGNLYTGRCAENITVRNATVKAYRWAGGIVGQAYGSVNGCTVENIEITMQFERLRSEWDNCDKAGAIIGQQCEGAYTLTGNRVSGARISGYRHIGGLAGHVNYGEPSRHKTVSDNSVTDAVISQNLLHDYKGITPGTLMGELAGEFGANVDQTGNTTSNVILDYVPIVTDAADLVTAATKGGTIILGADLDLSGTSGTLTLTKPSTLDLNGHTLTVKSGSFVNESDLTIDGEGTIASDGYAITSMSGSRLTVNGGTITSTGTAASHARAVHVEGDLEINGGIISCATREAVVLNWANENKTTHSAVITGGTLKAGNDYAFNAYGGMSGRSHKVVITGGDFIGTSGARADGSIDMRIDGGNFIQTSASSYGHAFCAGAESYGSEQCKVTVNGGYFSGNAGYAICNANKAVTTVYGGYLNKTGGGFTAGEGRTLTELATPASITVEGKTYTFGYRMK